MDSSIISKIEKARTYAEERERVTISTLDASFRGNHNSYQVGYSAGSWRCSCSFFASRALCSHTMALQRILQDMLPGEAKSGRL